MLEETLSAQLGDRRLFPMVQARIYWNHAAVSPPSEAVRMAILRALNDYAMHGAAAWMRWRDQREGLRASLGRLIGADPACIALLPSTSRAASDLALCLPWKAGETIVVFDGEFPTNVTPYQQAAQTFDLRLRFLSTADFAQDPAVGLERLEAVLKTGVRLVALSAVQFQTGLRMPVADICALAHRYGAEVAVDAIQSLGVVPLEIGAIDYLFAGSHKWLMGPEGAGFLYVRPGLRLLPRVAGWLSHENAATFLFREGELRYDRPLVDRPAVLEIGATNTLGMAGWEASVNLLLDLGIPSIYAHVQAIHDRLEPELLARGFQSARTPFIEGRSGILSVKPPESMSLSTLWSALQQAGVACAQPDGYLRLSPHWPSDAMQVDGFLEILDHILQGA